jgi:thioredoxin-like negative regulator of GroEL
MNFDYEKAIDICLYLLEKDYDNYRAHSIILETFNSLGFQNQLTIKTRDKLRAIVLNSNFYWLLYF